MEQETAKKLLQELVLLRQKVTKIEQRLRSLGISDFRILNTKQTLQITESLEDIAGVGQVYHLLARINFGDDYYRFIRAIDGDTIVVKPPSALQQWMKDIHVRLYGLETPELWTEHGPDYRDHLEELCAVDANGRLMIVWERERIGTNYEGYPLATFERGIGHVFYREHGDRYVYINGLMHLLRHSSLKREGKSLLRGRRHVNTPITLPWDGRCPSWQEHGERQPSKTLQTILALGPPACLLTYADIPSLNPRDENFADKINLVMRDNWKFGCPIENALHRDKDLMLERERAQQVSPFDIPLAYVSAWAAKQFQRDPGRDADTGRSTE